MSTFYHITSVFCRAKLDLGFRLPVSNNLLCGPQAKALAEKNMRDVLAQREQAEKNVSFLKINKM